MAKKPGEKALEAIKRLNSEVSLFKVPRAPRKKKNKMKILTEEKYIEELGKMIQKDFFPDLEKLKAQNQYLDAIEKNDVIKLRELYAKYSGKVPSNRTFGSESPATFETPEHGRSQTESDTPLSTQTKTPASATASDTASQKDSSTNHSLDSFLSTYTSEDNNSFQELIETADRKLRQKFSVLFDAEKETAAAVANNLALPSIEKQFQAIDGPKKVETWKYKNKNYIMYVPDGVELTNEEKLEMVKHRQEIVHSNTRLMGNPFDDYTSKEKISEMAKMQARVISGRIGVDGNALNAGSITTPNIRGFSFVKTPSPHPGVQDSPLMTWGELEGTPFRLDGGDTPIHSSSGPAFHIAENSRRETIGLQLAEKAAERMRSQKAKAIATARQNIASPQIRSTLDRIAQMSPAAKRLASAKIGVRDGLLTPSPRSVIVRTPQKSLTPSPLVRRKTPARELSNMRNSTTSSKTHLTDDLLHIPGKVDRPKASDYF